MKQCIVLFAIVIIFCGESFGAPSADIDLEKMAQEDVLEVKQLSFEKVLEEFRNLSNEEAYVNIFSKRMMQPVPGKESEFYGCNHRIDMLPFIQKLLANVPENGQIFDVGAGAGDVVDFALKGVSKGITINIEEPNPSLIKSYLKKLEEHHLRVGVVYDGILQDYYQGEHLGIYPSQPQNLILAMHMIYHLTDFTHEHIQPKEDLIEAFSFLYGLLAPGGTIFIAYADLLENEGSEAICGIAEKYFRHFYPNNYYADNLISIYKSRNELLGPNGSISDILAERFPGTKPTLRSELRMCHFFGKSIDDLAVLALATELCPPDNNRFAIEKLEFCFDYMMHNPGKFGLQKENKDVPQKGLWRGNEPHVIAIITKGK